MVQDCLENLFTKSIFLLFPWYLIINYRSINSIAHTQAVVHQAHSLTYCIKITMKIIWHWGARLSSWHLTLTWTLDLSWLHSCFTRRRPSQYSQWSLRSNLTLKCIIPRNIRSFFWEKTDQDAFWTHSLFYAHIIRLLGFMLLLGFRINFVLVLSKTQEQKVAMHIIIKHLYSFISVTATQTEYNSV